MAINLVLNICKIIGVKPKEVFKVKYNFTRETENKRNFRIAFCKADTSYDSKMYFMFRPADSTCQWSFSSPWAISVLYSLLNGDAEIIKLPWTPKIGEDYYSFYSDKNEPSWGVKKYNWTGSVFDYSLRKNGWIFQTKEEAVASLSKTAMSFGKQYKVENNETKVTSSM